MCIIAGIHCKCTIYCTLADDGCNTAIESFQTDRLLRVFHSCYFHYSVHYTIYNIHHTLYILNNIQYTWYTYLLHIIYVSLYKLQCSGEAKGRWGWAAPGGKIGAILNKCWSHIAPFSRLYLVKVVVQLKSQR